MDGFDGNSGPDRSLDSTESRRGRRSYKLVYTRSGLDLEIVLGLLIPFELSNGRSFTT